MVLRSFLCLAASAVVALGASLQQVTNFGANPSRINMYIYVPDKLATKPAIVVSMHACGGNAQGQFRGNRVQSYADQLGFILIVPGTPNMSNCWGVHSPDALTHGKGGDSLGIVSMVNYTLEKYSGDRDRVYMFGVSSGGMMANVLAGSYPDVFEAGAAYSGTAFACFAGAPQATPMAPNQTCAQGLQHTPEEWAAFVRNAYPGYTGRRTRMQIYHGLADGLVRPQCAVEALKQWSKVLDVPLTKNNTGVPSAAYTQQVYGDGTKLQGFFGQGVGHIAPVNEVYMLRFFGLLE